MVKYLDQPQIISGRNHPSNLKDLEMKTTV